MKIDNCKLRIGNSEREFMTRAQAKVEMAAEIRAIKGAIAMPTTGNAEQDEAHLEDAAVSMAMREAAFCPNGCGSMKVLYPLAECVGCGFSHIMA